MDVSIFDIVENGVSNKDIRDTVIEKLNDKYNEEFEVKMIGNRYGTSDDNTVTTFCFPISNENLLFTAILNKEQTELNDDYLLKKVNFEIEENIKKIFLLNNIETVVKTEIIGLNKLEKNLSVNDFIKKYNNTNFIANIICSDFITEDALEKIYREIEKIYKNINLKSSVYTIDKAKFNDFVLSSDKMPFVTTSIIRKYNIKDKKNIKIFEGNINIVN